MKVDLSIYSSSVGLNSGSSLIDPVVRCNLTHSLTTYLPTYIHTCLTTLISTHIDGYMSPSMHPFSNPSIKPSARHLSIKSTHLSILCPSVHPSSAYTHACSGTHTFEHAHTYIYIHVRIFTMPGSAVGSAADL